MTVVRKGGPMRKIVAIFVTGCLLSLTTAIPVFANEWGGPDYERGLPGGPLWPIVAAMSIPAAVIDTAMHIASRFQGLAQHR